MLRMSQLSGPLPSIWMYFQCKGCRYFVLLGKARHDYPKINVKETENVGTFLFRIMNDIQHILQVIK